jgi:hypothetical protein
MPFLSFMVQNIPFIQLILSKKTIEICKQKTFVPVVFFVVNFIFYLIYI